MEYDPAHNPHSAEQIEILGEILERQEMIIEQLESLSVYQSSYVVILGFIAALLLFILIASAWR